MVAEKQSNDPRQTADHRRPAAALVTPTLAGEHEYGKFFVFINDCIVVIYRRGLATFLARAQPDMDRAPGGLVLALRPWGRDWLWLIGIIAIAICLGCLTACNWSLPQFDPLMIDLPIIAAAACRSFYGYSPIHPRGIGTMLPFEIHEQMFPDAVRWVFAEGAEPNGALTTIGVDAFVVSKHAARLGSLPETEWD